MAGTLHLQNDFGNAVTIHLAHGDRDTLGYSFFFVPDAIKAWTDHLDYSGPEIEPALTIEETPLFLSPEEIADFKHALQKCTDRADWLELAPDAKAHMPQFSPSH